MDNEISTFDEVVDFLKNYPDFQKFEMQNESILSFPGIEIYPGRRKVYCNSKEIHLTVKEYKLLWLLVVNKGQVLTYQQIYEKVWGDFSSGGESTAIGYHIIYIHSLIIISGCFSCLNLRYSLTKTSLISGDSQNTYSIILLLPKNKGIIECVADICIPRKERGYKYRNAKRDLHIKKETV